MNRRDFLKVSAPLVMAPAFLPYGALAQTTLPPLALPPPGADGWVSLINGRDLAGWYTMLQTSGKGAAEELKMVMMEEQMLHIMGNQEEYQLRPRRSYIATNQEFTRMFTSAWSTSGA